VWRLRGELPGPRGPELVGLPAVHRYVALRWLRPVPRRVHYRPAFDPLEIIIYSRIYCPMKQGLKEKRLEQRKDVLEARKQAAVNAWKEKQEKDADELEKELVAEEGKADK
jgi:hypothetical protein